MAPIAAAAPSSRIVTLTARSSTSRVAIIATPDTQHSSGQQGRGTAHDAARNTILHFLFLRAV